MVSVSQLYKRNNKLKFPNFKKLHCYIPNHDFIGFKSRHQSTSDNENKFGPLKVYEVKTSSTVIQPSNNKVPK